MYSRDMATPGPVGRALPILAAWAFASAPRAQESSAPSEGTIPSESWSFTLEPYIWFAGIDGQASADGSGSEGLGPGLGEALGSLDAALPLAFEARAPAGRWALQADGFYLRFADDEGVDTQTEAVLFELAGAVPICRGGSTELLFGLRWVDLQFELTNLSASAEEAWLDPFVGARAQFALGGPWSLRLRGDVGGFGLGSDFAWQGVAVAGATLGRSWRLDFGYRAIGIDFDGGDLRYDALAHGPIVGLAWTP